MTLIDTIIFQRYLQSRMHEMFKLKRTVKRYYLDTLEKFDYKTIIIHRFYHYHQLPQTLPRFHLQ